MAIRGHTTWSPNSPRGTLAVVRRVRVAAATGPDGLKSSPSKEKTPHNAERSPWCRAQESRNRFHALRNADLRMLEKNSMKTNPTSNSDWNISFWFAVLSPLIGVALGFAAAAVIEAL